MAAYDNNPLLPDPQRVAAVRLRQLLSPETNHQMGMAMGLRANPMTGTRGVDKQMYNQLVAQAFNALQQEFGPDMGDPHQIFKMATGADLNSAMHVSDLAQRQAPDPYENVYVDPRQYEQSFNDTYNSGLVAPTHPGVGKGDMLQQYGFDPDADNSPVIRRLRNNR